jgi:hypothetical protein
MMPCGGPVCARQLRNSGEDLAHQPLGDDDQGSGLVRIPRYEHGITDPDAYQIK